MKIKQFKRKISSSIYAILIAISFLCSPICAQAQTVEFKDQQDTVFGTSNSRMVLTIVETTDHVELHVMGVGYIRADGFGSSVIYNPTTLILTDETFARDIPDGWDSGILGSVIKIDPQFEVAYPSVPYNYVTKATNHESVFGGMKVLNSSIHTTSIDVEAHSLRFYDGELRPVYRIFFRKQVSGAPLQTSDLGFYAQEGLMPISSHWTYNGSVVSAARTTLATSTSGLNANLFVYRSSSYAVTSPVTDATGTQATFNGAFKRGDFAPANMSINSLTASVDTARLNWDNISNYGFIYATTDHNITVDGVSKEITIDGTAYPFPTPVQLASGQFTFGSTTLNFKPFANSSANQTIASNPVITDLAVDTKYYVWTYLQYGFETSAGDYLYVGNKVDFTTLLCEIPALPIASSEQTLCDPATIADLVAEVESGTTLVWYNAATLGDEYDPTDALVDGETYYARAASGACESASLEVTVTLTSSLAAPSATTPQAFCTGSLVSDLQATGVNIEWYDAETGGTLISSTEELVDGQIYYAEQASATCVSTTRTAVKVIITDAGEINGPTIESPQYFCDNATLADIATDGSTIVWYSAGGALLPSTTYLRNGTTYYAAKSEGDCESTQRTSVLVYTGLTTPLAPQVDSPQRMFEGSTLQNIEVPNNKIIWYAAENSTMPLDPGTILADNVTYYAALVAGDCESAVRTPVLILMNGVPGPDVDSPQVICGDATLADLTVTGAGIVWYDSETGGTELPVSTPLPSTPTMYYAAQSSGSSTSDRVGVLVSASPTPTPNVAPIAICSNGSGNNGSVGEDGNATFDLTASVTEDPNYIYVYYDEDGNIIENPAKTGIPSSSGTYTYYVKTIDKVTGCESGLIAIEVTVNAVPEVTVTPAGAYTSVDGETTLTVTDNNTNGTKTITVKDPSIADVTLAADGTITIKGNARGNTEIVYTSIDENGCVTEVIIPIQVEGAPTGILTGKDIFVCNGDAAQTVQIAYIMGGIAPWTVTISDGTNTQDVVVNSIEDLPVNVNVTLPANTSDVPQFTTYVISNVEDSQGASKETHYGAVRFGINPTPEVRTIANSIQTICSGSATLPISVDGVATTYRFSVDENIGTINYTNNSVPSFTAVNNGATAITATITIVPEYWYNGIVCIGDTVEATITVKPAPTAAPVENVVLCSAGNLIVNFAGNADEYNWTVSGASIGIPTTGTGNINTAVAANNTSAPLVATITVTPKFTSIESDCEGNAISFTVTVMPMATINDVVAEHNLCNGMMTDAINFGSDVAGTVYRWTVSGASIGLPTSGTGSIASFRAINNGTTEATATITVTPEINGCVNTAAAKTITIRVQPTPFVAPAFDKTYCVGETVASVTGTDISWTQTGSNIGLSQTYGTGTIPSFTTANTTLLPQTATFEITPMSGTCAGKPVSFKVTVLPTVGVDAVASQELCTGQMTNTVLFNGVVPGTVYRWTNDNPAIGLAASGTGDIASFRAVNSGTTVATATITVTPEYSHAGLTCPTITPMTFTITVNPELTLGSIFDAIYCDGEATDVVTLPADATWVLSGSNIGSAMSGVGSIPSFTATNKSAQPLKGVFTVTLASGTCEGSTAAFEVTVNPELRLTSATTAPAVCGESNFNYTAASNVSGVAFAWTGSTGSSGVGAQINEMLTNSTDAPIAVTYTIEMTFVDCSATETVTVMVNPTPEVTLASTFEQACGSASQVEFTYTVNPAQTSLAVEYSITFSQNALFAGFANVSNETLAGGAIAVAIPTGLPTGRYSGLISFSAGGCTSAASSTEITIEVMGGVQILAQPTATNFCDGEGFVLSVNATGVNLTYQWFFFNGEELEELLGETSSTLVIAPDDAELFVGGTFFVDVISDCGTVRSVDVNVSKNALFILQKWDDVIFVSNVGDLFVDYQWYRDGNAIGRNGNFQYYSENGGLNGTYRVQVTLADRTTMMSCPYTVIKDEASSPAAIRIYPNPVQIGKEIVVDLSQLSIEESLNAKVFIYDASGRMVAYSVITNPVENIVVDVPVAGNYIVRVTTASGRVKSEKVVVVE